MKKQELIRKIKSLMQFAESKKEDYDSRLFYNGAIASLTILLEDIESMED